MDKFGGMGYTLSAALHVAVLLIVCFFNEDKPKKTNPPSLVELYDRIETPAPPSKVEKTKNLTKKKSKGGLSPSQKNSIFKKFSPQSYHVGSFADHVKATSEGGFHGDVIGTMQSMGLSEYSENRNFFETLGSKVNQAVLYPKELWEHKIDGEVWLKIEINQKGELLRIIESSKNNPILKTYVLICLYRTLKTSLPKRFWYSKSKNLPLYLKFKFSRTSTTGAVAKQEFSYFKNRFDFYRMAVIPNLIQEAYSDFARYTPPVIPTPLGPIVNFVQVYNMIEAWSDEDPLLQKANRRTVTREKLETLLKLSEKNHLNKSSSTAPAESKK